MRILIEIDEKIYNRIKNGEISDLITMYACGCIADGKPQESEVGE